MAVIGAFVTGIAAGTFWANRSQGPLPSSTADLPTHRAGPFRFAVSVDPEVPAVGNNSVMIDLTDLEGAPVSDAAITAVATMPA